MHCEQSPKQNSKKTSGSYSYVRSNCIARLVLAARLECGWQAPDDDELLRRLSQGTITHVYDADGRDACLLLLASLPGNDYIKSTYRARYRNPPVEEPSDGPMLVIVGMDNEPGVGAVTLHYWLRHDEVMCVKDSGRSLTRSIICGVGREPDLEPITGTVFRTGWSFSHIVGHITGQYNVISPGIDDILASEPVPGTHVPSTPVPGAPVQGDLGPVDVSPRGRWVGDLLALLAAQDLSPA